MHPPAVMKIHGTKLRMRALAPQATDPKALPLDQHLSLSIVNLKQFS
jgi:hypothetical protein